MKTAFKRHTASLSISVFVLLIAAGVTYSVNKPKVTCEQATEDVLMVIRQPWSSHEAKNIARDKADWACRAERFYR